MPGIGVEDRINTDRSEREEPPQHGEGGEEAHSGSLQADVKANSSPPTVF